MSGLLVLNSSIFGDNGQSSQLTAFYSEQWLAANPGGEVVVRNLLPETMPHLSAASFAAFAAQEPTPEQQAVLDLSNELLAEIRAADRIVVGIPMYNLLLPSCFKAYIDHITRAGVSFRYTESGPQGLLDDKPIDVISTRGGQYQGTPMDVETAYVKMVFQFLGMPSVNFIYAEGLALGEEAAKAAIGNARNTISNLFA